MSQRVEAWEIGRHAVPYSVWKEVTPGSNVEPGNVIVKEDHMVKVYSSWEFKEQFQWLYE